MEDYRIIFFPQQIKTILLKLKKSLCEQFLCVCVYVRWDVEGACACVVGGVWVWGRMV